MLLNAGLYINWSLMHGWGVNASNSLVRRPRASSDSISITLDLCITQQLMHRSKVDYPRSYRQNESLIKKKRDESDRKLGLKISAFLLTLTLRKGKTIHCMLTMFVPDRRKYHRCIVSDCWRQNNVDVRCHRIHPPVSRLFNRPSVTVGIMHGHVTVMGLWEVKIFPKHVCVVVIVWTRSSSSMLVSCSKHSNTTAKR